MTRGIKQHFWMPSGKTNEDILRDLLKEAQRIIQNYEEIDARHRREIDKYREENPIEKGRSSRSDWLQRTVLKNLIEMAEPEKVDYEFH